MRTGKVIAPGRTATLGHRAITLSKRTEQRGRGQVFSSTRGAFLAAVLAVAAGVGCQEEQVFSLKPFGFDITSPTTAREALRDPCTNVQDRDALVKEMLTAVNEIRTEAGVRTIRPSETLDKIADFYACRLIDGGFFDHEDPYDGSTIKTRAANFGYAFSKIGETLAAGHLSVDEVMKGWMESAPHRAVILDRAYVEIGVSVRVGGEYGTYWVLEFGRPIEADFARPVEESPDDKTDEALPIASQPATQPESQN